MGKIYTEEQVNVIREEIKKESYEKQLMQFAKQLESVSNNMIISQKKNMFSKKFNQDTVNQYLTNPQKYSAQLRELSAVLYTLSPMYSQIVNYYPGISRFIPVITPNLEKFTNRKGEITSEDTLRKEYIHAVNYVENMNIEHEFQKALEIATLQDVVYAYIHSDKSGKFYLQFLDADYCRITSISSGVFNFAFNFQYFDKNKNLKGLNDDGSSDDLINYYPEEFKIKYDKYSKDKTRKQWQEIDEQCGFAFKFNEGLPFEFPPYASLWSEISYLEDMRSLLKASKEVEAYKFIGMELPLKSNATKEDDFSVSVNTAMSFYQMLLSNLPEGIGAFLSATPFKDISFSGSNVGNNDQINNVENSLFVSSGISPTVFGKNSDSSTGLKSSNLQDSSRLYKLYEQFQRFLNRYLGFVFNDKFKVELLKVTTFTLDDEVKKQKEAMSLGVPNKLIVSSLLGISQADERSMSAMERILDLQNEWIPPMTSYTQTSSDSESVGRPESEDISESGERTKDRDDNIDK